MEVFSAEKLRIIAIAMRQGTQRDRKTPISYMQAFCMDGSTGALAGTPESCRNWQRKRFIIFGDPRMRRPVVGLVVLAMG